jgi:hypothetical protein
MVNRHHVQDCITWAAFLRNRSAHSWSAGKGHTENGGGGIDYIQILKIHYINFKGRRVGCTGVQIPLTMQAVSAGTAQRFPPTTEATRKINFLDEPLLTSELWCYDIVHQIPKQCQNLTVSQSASRRDRAGPDVKHDCWSASFLSWPDMRTCTGPFYSC